MREPRGFRQPVPRPRARAAPSRRRRAAARARRTRSARRPPATVRHERVSPATATTSAAIPSRSSSAAIHRPEWPPSGATARTPAPSAAAARATLSPLPPATATWRCGRWIAPGTRRATSNSRSIDGVVATQSDHVSARASSIVGWAAVPPAARGGQRAAGHGERERRPERLARETSGDEAGVERVAGAGGVHELDRAAPAHAAVSAPAYAAAPRGPSFSTTTAPRAASARAHRAGLPPPASRTASSALGKRMSARGGERPALARIPAGVERRRRARRAGARRRAVAAPDARRGCRNGDATWTCRESRAAPRQRVAGSSAAERSRRGEDRAVVVAHEPDADAGRPPPPRPPRARRRRRRPAASPG